MINWYLLAITSALFSAAAAIVEKKILFKEKALSFSAVLAIFNLIIAIPFFFFIETNSLTPVNVSVLFIKTILEALAFLSVMIAIKDLELSSALPLLVLTPGLVALFAFFSLGEVLSQQEILGLFLLLTGTYVLGLKEKQKILDPFKAFINSKGHRYIVYALLLFTISSILDKAILKNFQLPVNAFIGLQHLFLAIIFLVIILFMGKAKELKSTFKFSWSWILILAFITITYRYTQIQAVKLSSSVALVLALKRISVFFAAVIGGKIFKEHNLLRKSIATLILVIGAVLVILPS